MKYLNFKNYRLLLIGFSCVFISIIGLKYQQQFRRIIFKLYYWENTFNPDPSCKDCEILFRDGVLDHEKAYLNEGIKPKKDFDDVQKLIKRGKLVKIKTNDNYIVEPMEASLPAVLPKGVNFLNRLSKVYELKCTENNLKYIPFRITSAIRTYESIKELRKINGNAIENSAHLKGKTIDISYLFSKNHSKQKNLFIQSLLKLKVEGLCYVKYETKMKCFHITIR